MDALAEKDRLLKEMDEMNVEHGWATIEVDIQDRAQENLDEKK